SLAYKERSELRLVILGEGDQRDKHERLREILELQDVVELPGADPNPFLWFARRAIFALSSKWEGFGNVLVQALACRCRIVSSDCPSGPREILDDGRFGELVPPGATELFAEALLGAEDRKQPPEEVLVARAREFSVTRTVDAYLQIFNLKNDTS